MLFSYEYEEAEPEKDNPEDGEDRNILNMGQLMESV